MTTRTVERPGALHQVGRAARRALEVTFVDPVTEGRPVPSAWPAGLAAVGWTTAALVVALTVVAAFTGVIRQHATFVSSQSSDRSVPGLLLPLFLLAVLWTMGLAHCAVVRLAWYLKLPALGVGVGATATLSVLSFADPLVLVVTWVAYLAVVVLVLARRRRPYAWWEFPLVTTLVGVAWAAPLVMPTTATQLGADVRVVVVEAAVATFSSLAMPALVAAGVAPAIVTVTAAEAVASRAVPRGVAVAGLVAVVAWRVVTIVTTVRNDPVEQGWSALSASAVLVALVALGLAAVWRLSPRREVTRPGDLPELWTVWSFVLGVTLTGAVVVVVPLVVVRFFAVWFHLPGASLAVQLSDAFEASGWFWSRILAAVALVVVAVVLARRSRTGVASLFLSVGIATATTAVSGYLPTALLRARTPEAVAAVTSVVAVVTLVVTAAFGELTRRRAVGLVTVLLVGGLYTYRDTLDDPVSAIVGYAGLATALFGLVWQGLTGAGFTRGTSRRLPQSTRVLAYLANTLFAFCVVAFVAASRSVTDTLSLTDLDATGDSALGTPLLVAATVLGLWYGFGAGERRDEPAGGV